MLTALVVCAVLCSFLFQFHSLSFTVLFYSSDLPQSQTHGLHRALPVSSIKASHYKFKLLIAEQLHWYNVNEIDSTIVFWNNKKCIMFISQLKCGHLLQSQHAGQQEMCKL